MEATQKFRRSRDRVIAGVCGGIAERLGWPVGRVRLAYVILSVLSAAFPASSSTSSCGSLCPDRRVDPVAAACPLAAVRASVSTAWNVRCEMYRASVGGLIAWSIRLALIGALAFVTAGCASTPRVVTDVLDDGTTTYTLANNEIKVEGATKYYGFEEGSSIVEKRCVLDVRACEKEGKETTFELLAHLHGRQRAEHRTRPFSRSSRRLEHLCAFRPGRREEGERSVGTTIHRIAGLPGVRRRAHRDGRGRDALVTVKGRDGDARGSFGRRTSRTSGSSSTRARPAAVGRTARDLLPPPYRAVIPLRETPPERSARTRGRANAARWTSGL